MGGDANMFSLIEKFRVFETIKQYKELILKSEEGGFKIDFEAMMLNLIVVANL